MRDVRRPLCSVQSSTRTEHGNITEEFETGGADSSTQAYCLLLLPFFGVTPALGCGAPEYRFQRSSISVAKRD